MNIAEVMDMTANKASEMFAGTVIAEKLEPLRKVGLGYLHLNQSLSTLSGGELQRIKLASYLVELLNVEMTIRRSQSLNCCRDKSTIKQLNTSTLQHPKIFIMDEPSDGLHLNDIKRILDLFDTMVEAGNTIFLIEQNLEMLKQCDYLIELGPGGGAMGGKVLFTGTPKEMLGCNASVTAPYMTVL